MTSRKNPYTSKLAHDSIKPVKDAIYEIIIDAMVKMRVGGTFEEISKIANLTPAQTWRRLSELVEKGICFNTGVTHTTSSGRSAMVRQLTSLKPLPKHSESIIKSTNVVQQDLFNQVNL